jgi:mono/diheme cytochrome c family protein
MFRELSQVGWHHALAVARLDCAAQNLDQGKSAMRLFADICATCHRSARGLAKGRFRPTLFLFLQEHYATNSSTAWDLASYLASVDSPQKRPIASCGAEAVARCCTSVPDPSADAVAIQSIELRLARN